MDAELAITEPHAERRQLPRLNVSAPIQFRNVFKPHEQFTGTLSKNLSSGGLRIALPTFLPKDTRLVLIFSLPNSLKQIRAIGRVVWLEEHAFSDAYDSGIQFIEMEDQDNKMISEFVEQHLFTDWGRSENLAQKEFA